MFHSRFFLISKESVFTFLEIIITVVILGAIMSLGAIQYKRNIVRAELEEGKQLLYAMYMNVMRAEVEGLDPIAHALDGIPPAQYFDTTVDPSFIVSYYPGPPIEIRLMLRSKKGGYYLSLRYHPTEKTIEFDCMNRGSAECRQAGF